MFDLFNAPTINASVGAYQVNVGPAGAFFNGIIDEVKIWNRTLTDQEILREYNGP